MKSSDSIKLECNKTIELIKENINPHKSFDYFLNTIKNYYDTLLEAHNKPRLIILDYFFPEEIIRALNVNYYYVFGGSFEATLLCPSIVPKRIDDGTKSIIGMLESLDLNQDDAILVPLVNDNMRKLGSLFDSVTNVITYEVIENENRYIQEIKRVSDKIRKHFKTKLPSSRLKKECNVSKQIACQFLKLEKIHNEENSSLSSIEFLCVSNAYFMSHDKLEWCNHVDELINEIEVNKEQKTTGLLIFGSPIYFPNYKILIALIKAGIDIQKFIHPDHEFLKVFREFSNKMTINRIAKQYFNSNLLKLYFNGFTNLVVNECHKYKGLLGHIIKGQINNDIQYKLVENSIANLDVSINKIETTLNYQDIEQIKIKLDTIKEILF